MERRNAKAKSHHSRDYTQQSHELISEPDPNQMDVVMDYTDIRKPDYEDIELKPDHETRPIWVCADGTIYLETFAPHEREATQFLIALAEPQSRPVHIHMYKLTSTSLYAAASVELKKDDLIRLLDKFSKSMVVLVEVDEMIEEHTRAYGKAKLVLQDNKYYIEAEKEMMDRLLKIEVISAARKKALEQD